MHAPAPVVAAPAATTAATTAPPSAVPEAVTAQPLGGAVTGDWDVGRVGVGPPPAPDLPAVAGAAAAAPVVGTADTADVLAIAQLPGVGAVLATPAPPRAVSPPGHLTEQRADRAAGWARTPARPGAIAAQLPSTGDLDAAARTPVRPGTLIHQGAAVDRVAAAIGAGGFSFGGHVFLSSRAIAGPDHARILDHELAHARYDNPELLHADGQIPTVEEFLAHPPVARLHVTLDGLLLTPVDAAEFLYPADERVLYALVAFRLAGERYDAAMVPGIAAAATAAGGSITGLPPQRSERARVSVGLVPAYLAAIRGWLRDHGRSDTLDISAQQERMLLAGRMFPPPRAVLDAAQAEIRRRGLLLSAGLPREVMTGVVAQYGRQLWPYVDAVVAWESSPTAANLAAAVGRYVELLVAFAPVSNLITRVFGDRSLADHAAYQLLFPENAAADHEKLLSFYVYIPTQPQGLIERANTSSDGRIDLLDGFLHYLGRQRSARPGDTVITDEPSRVNAPPLPSRMSVHPALEPPHFDAATGAKHHFTMAIEWPDIYEALGDAFGGWSYEWDLIQVRDDDLANLPEATEAQGRAPSFWDPLASDLARDVRYAGEDMERVRRTLGTLELAYGPPGLGAQSLVAASAMIGMVGTVISNVISELTEPRNEETFALEDDGLFIVRCRAVARLDDDRETSVFRRATSVAWLPFWGRSPRSMAELRTAGRTTALTAGEARLAELESLLADPDESLPDRAALTVERDALRRELRGSTLEILDARLTDLRARQLRITSGRPQPGDEAYTPAAISSEIESVQAMMRMRVGRTTVTTNRPVRLPATLVTDTGSPIHLLIEAARLDDGLDPRRAHWVVSDLTTDRSGYADEWSDGTRVPGNPSHDAIVGALLTILEGQSGYGGGYLSVFLPTAGTQGVARPSMGGVAHTVRVARSLDTIAVNAIENITQLISIAAVVAAPFTGGASLTLLVPVGIVGALPSAYRLYHRSEMGTLRMDLQTAMEIVDIAGAVVGIGEISVGARAATATSRGLTRSALRYARVQGALWIVGLGADGLGMVMMGAGVLQQLSALDGLPAGLRAARAAEILGNAMMQLGIQAGGALASRRYGSSLHDTLDERAGDSRLALDARMRGTETGVGADVAAPLRWMVEENAELATGEVRVVFEHLDGLVDASSIRLQVGPGAAHNVAAHLPLITALRGYSGVSGRIRRAINRLRRFLTGRSEPEVGSALFEARLELTKLDALVGQRLEALARTREAGLVDDLLGDIAHLDAQIERHQRTIDEGIEADGRGYIAVEGGAARDITRTEALAAGYPVPPVGHFYRRGPGGEGFILAVDPLHPQGAGFVRYTVRRHGSEWVLLRAGAESELNTQLAVRDGYDPPLPGHQYLRDGTEWELSLVPGSTERSQRVVRGPDRRPLRGPGGAMLTELRPQRTFETRQAEAAIAYPTGDYTPLEAALTGRGLPPDARARGLLRGWAEAMRVMDELVELNPGQNLRTGAEVALRAAAHLTAGYTDAAYGRFRRQARADMLDLIVGGDATPAVQRGRLDLLLAALPDNASSGALFSGWIGRRLGGGNDVAGMASLRDRELQMGPGRGKDRDADGAARITTTRDGAVVTEDLLLENKVGRSYDPEQAAAYSDNIRANRGEAVTIDGTRYAGVAYICENATNARLIAANLTSLGLDAKIRVFYVDAGGNLQPMPRTAAAAPAAPAGAPPAAGLAPPDVGETE